MSHPQNDAYYEQLEMAEEDYKDALSALITATDDYQKAYLWKRKMELNANQKERELKALKEKE